MNYIVTFEQKQLTELQNEVNKFLEQNKNDQLMFINYLINVEGTYVAILTMAKLES